MPRERATEPGQFIHRDADDADSSLCCVTQHLDDLGVGQVAEPCGAVRDEERTQPRNAFLAREVAKLFTWASSGATVTGSAATRSSLRVAATGSAATGASTPVAATGSAARSSSGVPCGSWPVQSPPPSSA